MTTAHATPEDYARSRALPEPPEGIEPTLSKASALVDGLLLTATYPPPRPGGPVVRHALREATCATVAWWSHTAGPAPRRYDTMAQVRSSGAQVTRVGPEAVRILTAAGLLGDPPVRHWGAEWR
ncbi:hypothetical protein [Amycolatopsis albispora]|uniref:Uncharacterized protein n=1 Tax=Amycolatopsis albispora TaxID=1804986 RepID=A0A344LHS2_9PSEU|nr:hypothetical protein [Amycolatopsis albispora]AXB47596.1 hypothetical protein A4R43_38310 [Amycolatopsis albispora]